MGARLRLIQSFGSTTIQPNLGHFSKRFAQLQRLGSHYNYFSDVELRGMHDTHIRRDHASVRDCALRNPSRNAL